MPLLTQVKRGEALSVKALIMGEVENPLLHYRPLGTQTFSEVPLQHQDRGVFRGIIPGQAEDFEWYVSAETSLGKVLFPATAGADDSEMIFQTVVVMDEAYK